MAARAYTTTLSRSDEWGAAGLEIASIPAAFISLPALDDIVGSIGLEAQAFVQFDDVNEVRRQLSLHFAAIAGLAELVDVAFDEPLTVVEESAGRGRAISAVAGAGALATGFAIFGPWAIIALPVGVFLLAAAPEAGEGFGAWVGAWFRRRIPK